MCRIGSDTVMNDELYPNIENVLMYVHQHIFYVWVKFIVKIIDNKIIVWKVSA